MADLPAFLQAVSWEQSKDYAPNLDGIPVATHHGVLEIGDVRLNCYRLDDGRAIVDADDFAQLLKAWGFVP